MNGSKYGWAIISLAFIACSDGEPDKSRGNSNSQIENASPPLVFEEMKFAMGDGTVRDGAVQWSIWRNSDVSGPEAYSTLIVEIRDDRNQVVHVKLSFLPRFIDAEVDVRLEDVLGYAYVVEPRIRSDVGSVKYKMLSGGIIEGEVSAIFEDSDVSFEGARFRGTLLVDCIGRQDQKFCDDSYNYVLAGGIQ